MTTNQCSDMNRLRWFVYGAVLFGGVAIAGVFVVHPLVRAVEEDANRLKCRSRLSQLANALDNYQQVFGCLPPQGIVDSNGCRIHSWRALLLPFVEQETLYHLVDFSVPWNHPDNLRLAAEHASVARLCFQCPSDTDTGVVNTNYFAVLDPRHTWPGRDALRAQPLSVVRLITERSRSRIPWMQPVDCVLAGQEATLFCLPTSHSAFSHCVDLASGNSIRTTAIPFENNCSELAAVLNNSSGSKRFHQPLPGLIVRLESRLMDPDPTVRHGAALLLSQLGVQAKGSLPILRGLRNDSSRSVQKVSVFAVHLIEEAIRRSRNAKE